MIEFQKLRWKNFLSTGNSFTELHLNTHKNTLIVGENGSGKSTILDALSFALFGKPFRKINKPQLLNSINEKGLLVECEFTVRGKSYVIRRGIKPSIFEIYCNGSLINVDADIDDYQEVVEKQILNFNHKSFSQIIVLGSASFVPFMQLSAAHRREVIEELLDIQIFTTMNVLLKDKISENKNLIQDTSSNIKHLRDKIELTEAHEKEVINDINDQLDKIKQKQEGLKQQYQSYKQINDDLQHQLSNVKQGLVDEKKYHARTNKLTKLFSQLSVKEEKIKEEITFFSQHHDCPTCKQSIDADHKHEIVLGMTTTLTEVNEACKKIKHQLQEAEQQLETNKNIYVEVSKIEQSVRTNEYNLHMCNFMMQENEKEIIALAEKRNQKVDGIKVDAYIKELEQAQQKYNNAVKQKNVLDVAATLLKDAGIKTKIIRQYVPVINKLINKYLASMDFFVNFELNESFEETIKSRYRDEFSYASFSEGEKSRIDLALLFTWRAIAKLRNSVSTNLLILDEVFDGSLDAHGNEELLKIIQTLTEGSNVFVISHKTDAYLDKFERILRFEKHKNFSKMVIL